VAKYLLGVDAGTTGCKACVFDLEGNILGTDYREYPCYYPKPGWVEQDLEEITEALFETVKATIAKSGVNPKDIVSMALSTQGSAWQPLDKDGNLLRPSIGWQDTRGIEYVKKIRNNEIFNKEEYYKITGYNIGTVHGSTKFLWFKDNEPELFEKTAMFSQHQDYFARQFGAEGYWADTATASRTGIFDIDNAKWSEAIFEAYGLDVDKFPKIGKGGQIIGKIPKHVSEKTGLAEGTLICLGAMDQNCSTLGAGLIHDGDAVLVMGTYGSIYVCSDKPIRDPNQILMVKGNTGPENFTIEASSPASASSYRWFRDTFCKMEKSVAGDVGVDAYELINKQIEQVKPGANGITFLPYLQGASGGARDNPFARGAILGATLSTTKAEIARAVMEGITFEMRDNIEAQQNAGVEIKEITLTGGATKSKMWCQMQADIYKVPVKTLQTSETGCLGAAIYAGIGAGLFKDYEEAVEKLVHVKDVYYPNPQNFDAYDEAYNRFKIAFESLSKGGYFEATHNLKS